MYPLSSSMERKKNSVTMIGRKLSTLPTPLNIPSITSECSTGLISAAVMGIVVWGIYHLVSLAAGNVISTLLSVLCGVIVYAALILKLKGITAEEIERLPKGSKIVEILRLKGGKH